jgi:hypothetical protein
VVTDGAMEGGKVVTVTVGILEGDKVVTVTVGGEDGGEEAMSRIVGAAVMVTTGATVGGVGAPSVGGLGVTTGTIGANVGGGCGDTALVVGADCGGLGVLLFLLGAILGDLNRGCGAAVGVGTTRGSVGGEGITMAARMGATVGGGGATGTLTADVGVVGVTTVVVVGGLGVIATIGAAVGDSLGLLTGRMGASVGGLFKVGGWTGVVATTGCRTTTIEDVPEDASARVSVVVGAGGITTPMGGAPVVVVVGDGRGGRGAAATGVDVGGFVGVVVGDCVISRISVSALANNRI